MDRSSIITVRRVIWSTAVGELRAIRKTVFIDEQHVPEELEWDVIDDKCLHVIAVTDSGEPVGTARLLPDGHIGRMAVLLPWRRRGIGGMLLTELLAAAREKRYPSIELSAQTHAIGFYRQFGFEIVSDEYFDAGIPHRTMRLPLITPLQP